MTSETGRAAKADKADKPAKPTKRRRTTPPMKPSEAEELYGIHRWGAGYFDVGDDGNLRVHPTRTPDLWFNIVDVVDRLRKRRIRTPVVLRFPQIIATRVAELHDAFSKSIAEYSYSGRYRGVFPVKVNQMEPFIRGLIDAGREHGYSLEAGTKPELLMAFSSGLPRGSLVICNGYKDTAYVELALAGMTLGYEVVIVIEKLHELQLVLRVAKRLGIKPWLGVRVRIAARGTGKWARSGGDASKFGLSTTEILAAIEKLRAEGWEDQLRLVHFHIGSQITEIRRIKQGVLEGVRFYAALRARGFEELRYLDVGGGLGVDYDGSATASDSSVNYTLQEYANDVVYSVHEVCQESGVPEPDIISESGRAVSAYHAMTIFSVEETQTKSLPVSPPPLTDEADRCVHELSEIGAEIGRKNFIECYHDTLALVEQLHVLFKHGHISLEERAVGETAAAQILKDVVYYARLSGRRIPEEIEELEQDTSTKYVCNLSIFQSMPDHWAIGQLFPICPIHRLDERPTEWATIADITCDSDGKIDKFGDVREDQEAIRLHELNGKPYHLGAFLLGAYQDVMGNHHNLLGETDEASVVVTGAGEADIALGRSGLQNCAQVLELFGHRRREMRDRFMEGLAWAEENGASEESRRKALGTFRKILNGSPYLT